MLNMTIVKLYGKHMAPYTPFSSTEDSSKVYIVKVLPQFSMLSVSDKGFIIFKNCVTYQEFVDTAKS